MGAGGWAGGCTAGHLPWGTPLFGGAGLFLRAGAVLVLARQLQLAPVLQPPGRPGGAAITMVRQFLFDAYSVLLLDQLSRSTSEPLAAIAAKSLKADN